MRTSINFKNIKNRNLTGASFIHELGFYDETSNYSKDQIVTWKGQKYIANKNITSSTTEGDLSNAPDVSSDWDVLKSPIFSCYPSSADTINNSRVTISFDTVRYSSITDAFDVSNGEITFKTNGTFLFQCSLSFTNTSTTRNTVTSYISMDTGSGYTDISNVSLYNYSRTTADGKDTSSFMLPLDVNSGDKIRIQSVGRTSNNLNTIPAGCNITIFPIASVSGPKGDVGPAGPAGDLHWRGVYDNSTSYVENDTVEYQGSTFVSCGNTSGTAPGDPDSPNTPWKLVAKKGADGSGATINIQDEGANIPNTPHGTLNFIGDAITTTDTGSGVADITITLPKNTYMIPIWAEENASLANNTYEWAFGNGANTPNRHGVTIYVPSSYKCELVAMSLTLRQGTATVEAEKSGTTLGSSAQVSVSSGNSNTAEFSSPVEFSNNDVLNFHTVTQNNTGGPNVVTAWLKYTEL